MHTLLVDNNVKLNLFLKISNIMKNKTKITKIRWWKEQEKHFYNYVKLN